MVIFYSMKYEYDYLPAESLSSRRLATKITGIIKKYSADSSINFVDTTSKSEKSKKSASIQTSKLSVSDYSTQSLENKNQGIQTDETNENVDFVETNTTKLMSFLRQVEPMFKRTIDENWRSKAFRIYHSNVPIDDELLSPKLILKQDLEAESEQKMHPIALSWNSSGTTIGVAYGILNHEDWCTHKGYISTWNIERKSLNASKADIILEMESCATILKFNPITPGLLVSGGFTGELNVFNLTADADAMNAAHSRNHQNGHTEAVSGINWIQKSSTKADFASCGYDGKIILWSIPDRGEDLVVTQIFMITISNLPRSLRGTVSSTGKETGVSSFCFIHNEPNLFIAGGETGALLHCSITSRDPLASKEDTEFSIYNPVILALKPHKGPVHSLQASTYHRNLFLSGGADGTVRIYNMLKLEPLIIFNVSPASVLDVSWSPIRPTVFACATFNGTVLLYDLMISENEALLVKETNAEKATSVQSISFNPTRFDIFAASNDDNTVHVWELGERLTSILPNEQQLLNSIAMRVPAD